MFSFQLSILLKGFGLKTFESVCKKRDSNQRTVVTRARLVIPVKSFWKSLTTAPTVKTILITYYSVYF